MNRVVHFSINCDDPQRAILFYQKVFDWTIKKWEGQGMDYWMIMTGTKEEPGIDGGLSKRKEAGACACADQAIICTIGVESIDDMTAKVIANGGTVVMPKMELMKAGWFTSCKDTKGNIFSLTQATVPAM